jgi:hypothetical protein
MTTPRSLESAVRIAALGDPRCGSTTFSGSADPLLRVAIDGTGIPVVRKETQGRIGEVEGRPAHTREVKLGCVFTSAGVDKEDRPIRDPASTTCTGAIETAAEFARRIEAFQRDGPRARIKAGLGDGAVRIWNLAAGTGRGAPVLNAYPGSFQPLR